MVLFVSTDKGKTYKEIPLEGNYFDSFYKTENYCIIETSGELHFIYLFNNKTLKVEKIDECDNDLSIWYGIFDGRYIMYDNKENEYVMDISNRSKMYEIPKAIKDIHMPLFKWNTGDTLPCISVFARTTSPPNASPIV